MKHIKIYSIILLAILVLSCDRSGIFEEFDKATPWEFRVQVFEDNNMTIHIEDAVVNIYKTTQDRDNNTNVFLTKNTDSNGIATFNLKDFDSNSNPENAKGIYYLRVQKGNKIKNEITRYLLMNDGYTYHNVKLN